ncbi:lysine transporter LysE [Thalassotalea insulae]|uniref:Lysine transporter LysE n=1 Tax=Thalassotalea insulae TaxID=2056778 RepID=A0ABQ6GXF9_9GAMM|nr:LysE family translocator [Thalassotalea insulae]GLX79210.1 lysine transporter LysE [Thalassotalea insulae]
MNEQLMALLLPLTVFTITATSTPGPNNMLLSANGARFGFRASMPFLLGIRFGNLLLVLLLSLGLGALFTHYPNAQQGLKVLCIGYLLYLAAKIALATPELDSQSQTRPLGFWHGAGFQFINPKTWMTGLSCLSAFTLVGDDYFYSVLMVMVAWSLTGLVGSVFWVCCGVAMRRVLKSPGHWKMFNFTLALAIVASIFLIVK